MAKRAIEHMFTGATGLYSAGYDSSETMLGQWIQQRTGALETDKFAGPLPMSVARPMEASTAIPVFYPHAINVGGGIYWVFLADNATAAATRRIVLYTFNTATGAWSWQGFITLTYPAATNHTIRALRVVNYEYSTGTVAVSGTSVTGTSTAWSTARFAVGSRIGFGSTNPANITTWYNVTAMGSDTAITLNTTAGTIGSGTAYCLQETRVYTATTNATATNGGLFVAKGVNFSDFTTGGTTIAAATSTDNIKAVYWLADASTVLNTAAGGIGIGSAAYTNTNHDMYVINADAGTTLRVYKYNVRAALTVASGKSTNAFVLRTGQQTVTGTISQTNSSRICTLQHGPGSGVSCLYLATTTRIVRIPEASIVDASTTYVADSMVEVPPGGVNTFAATSAMTSVEHSGVIDRLIITTGSGQRHYVTQYNTVSTPFDKVIFSDNKQLDQSIADAGIAPYPSTQGSGFSVWVEDGLGFFCRNLTTAAGNQIYPIPLAADWDHAVGTSDATQNRLITPSLAVPDCQKLSRLMIARDRLIGSSNALGLQPEPFRVYYRTSGITDNSGSWTLCSETGDMSSVGAVTNIQFMFEFKVMGITCLPARIFGLVLTYDDNSTSYQFQPSVKNSDVVNKRFAWRFATAFGGTVPTLTVTLYNAVTGSQLLTDTTAASASGTFEKSTDGGGSWGSYNTTDKGNETTYIRYTPTSLADNIRVRAVLSS